jgi:hypothetical protein
LRFVAVGLWLVSFLLAYGLVSIWNRPEIAERRIEDPVLAWTVTIVGIVLPAMGFALIGIASWWRRWWVALVGVGAFLPLLAFLLFHWLRQTW